VDLDATLLPAPVYGQVPAIAAGQRGVIDLLACDLILTVCHGLEPFGEGLAGGDRVVKCT